VPATVQTILAARIDRLAPEEKRLLQAAAVIGKTVRHALLAAIVDLPQETLRRGLAQVQEAELLYETQLVEDQEYTFKHALTHEVTYGSLLQDRRRQLHANIVAACERLYADRISEHIERLAHHALRGRLWDKAVAYSRQAGARALSRSALRPALAHFERARAALDKLPENRERTEQRIDLCLEQRSALLPLGEFARVGEILDEARTLAERLQDQRRLGWVLAYEANLHNILGEHALAAIAGDGACNIGEAVGDHALRIGASHYLAQALQFTDPRRAAEILRAAVILLEDTPLREPFPFAALPGGPILRYALAHVLADLGEFGEAISSGQEGLRIAEAASHLYSEVWARYGLGYAHLLRGDFETASEVLQKSLALCRAMENRLALPSVALCLGCAYLWCGRVTDAVPLLEEVVEAITAVKMGRRSWIFTFVAQAYLVLGRITEARELALEVLAVARTHQQRHVEAVGLKLLGDVHAQEPSEAKLAGETYRHALMLASDLGLRPLVAHCHLALGKLHIRTGLREQARAHLAAAMTLYREMDMRFWLDQAQAELRTPV
jgi:tetratricopeptide (TPR) repeat protein